jgi:DNA invertase Pin-like site-specific DNA recombinase
MNPYITMTTDIRAAIYARVSSTGERQSTERQVIDLTDYANKNTMTICRTFEEHISGAKKNHERPVLQECLTYCIEEKVDVLLLSELSRLGRNVDEVLANIRFAKENRLNVYFQKEGISIYGTDGKENPYLTIMIAVLGTCAQMERENIHYRLQSGRKVYVDKNLAATGKSGLGRKEGYRKPVETKKEEYKEVLKLLRSGYPIRKVAKLTDVSESTIKRLKKEFGI